jgi:SnoaL-like polyketide cyclase
MTYDPTLPFKLPVRSPVTRIRQRDMADLMKGPPERTQPMAGYDPQYGDIVDFIVRITEEIWRARAIGRIYETYDASCMIYGSSSVIVSVEEVVAATIGNLSAYPDQVTDHVSITWRGDDREGFYTSHLGYSCATNLGASDLGHATGKQVRSYFVADCISRDNRIHTEWLMHDSGALLHDLGLDLHEVARKAAQSVPAIIFVVSPQTRLDGQAPRQFYDGSNDTPDTWALHHFDTVWNARRFEHVPFHFSADAVAHWPGHRTANGPRAIGDLIIGLLTSVPDALVRVEHVSWSEETDGVILGVRWLLEGRTRQGGMLGEVPTGQAVGIRGSSHFRFGDGHVVEEWTVFDELDAVTQAYRSVARDAGQAEPILEETACA